jgi:hypothetical protein
VLVALWGCGADLYLHERIEHDHAAEITAFLRAKVSHHAQCFADNEVDEHGCITCSILATMTASGWSYVSMIPMPSPAAIEPSAVSERPPHRIDLRTPPVRGPPSIV